MITFDLSIYEDPMEDVFYGDDFEAVTEESIDGGSRWAVYLSQVLLHKESQTFWRADWTCGATEYQEEDPNLTLTKVEPYEVTTTEYRPAKE